MQPLDHAQLSTAPALIHPPPPEPSSPKSRRGVIHRTPSATSVAVPAPLIPIQRCPLQLVRGKRDVLNFFQGCGVPRAYLDILEPWTKKDSGYSKYHIARQVLTHLNELGDAGLAQRRQLIKRVSEFENFSACWPDDQLKAKGAVAAVAQLVNKKDAFTRLQEEREREQRDHRTAKKAEAEHRAAARATRERIKTDLYRLFGETDPHRRGKALEGVLNRLFQANDILVREAFVVTGEDGDGIIEQIDGAVEIDGRIYLVEMKWWDRPLGRAEVSPHLVSVYGRAEAGGIFISNSGYHDSAVAVYESALTQRTVILVELQEIVTVLERELALLDLLRPKLHEATLSKRPLTHPLGHVPAPPS